MKRSVFRLVRKSGWPVLVEVTLLKSSVCRMANGIGAQDGKNKMELSFLFGKSPSCFYFIGKLVKVGEEFPILNNPVFFKFGKRVPVGKLTSFFP